MLNYLVITILSFLFTFALSVPFIDLLYKLKIRRLSEINLDKVLPGRTNIKLGTPIMGGTVIVITLIFLSTLLLKDWEYYEMIIFISIVGWILGFIDEYTNALGRTFSALRKSKGVRASLFKAPKGLLKIKKTILVPWRVFEEAIRIMGSEQRGIKNHYKVLMYLFLALGIVYYFITNGHVTSLYLPYYGSFLISPVAYYSVLFFTLIFYATAFGITDGLDGLSAGTHAISFLAYGLLAVYLGVPEIATVAFILVGAELAFLYFNIKPARMQMSDVGTVPLGMLFVIIAALLNREITLPLIGAIFTVEILSSVTQQWSVKLRKKRIFLIAPIHHHFEKLGWSETKVVERFWLFTVLSSVVGLIVALV